MKILTEHSSAVISTDGVYRYWLHRRWKTLNPEKTAIFVMLNPSTADEKTDDPTIRKCIKFADKFGCDRLSVVNLFGLRVTNPDELSGHLNPVGPNNDLHLNICFETNKKSLVIFAWGNQGKLNQQDERVRQLAYKAGITPFAFGFNKNGTPKHPLYQPDNQALFAMPVTQ